LKKVAFIFGTRPEAIKLFPLILAFREHPRLETHVCVTGQHREMLDQILTEFGIVPEVDLHLMQHNQTLSSLASRAIAAIDGYLSDYNPDIVLVQGDTTTVLCASLAAFYHRIPVGHIEAGLRTWDRYFPYPEEINRVLTTRLVEYHFAPTIKAKGNLLKEGVSIDRILVTGNTVIDALQLAIQKVRLSNGKISNITEKLTNQENSKPMVLITGHRRENFGRGFQNICEAIAQLANIFPDTSFVYPVHLNPNVREPVFRRLNNYHNVFLIDPLDYLSFVALMDRSTLILTDSGGIQEEAPSLGKPVLVMRDETERPEAIEAGTVKLVGTDLKCIVDNVSQLLTDTDTYQSMARAINPYGDGKASQRILTACLDILV